MLTKPRTFRVPLRTSELKLNCSMNSDPRGTIEWLFASNDELGINYVPKNRFDTRNYFENKFHTEWRSINALASYSFVKLAHNSLNANGVLYANKEQNSTFAKLALSKYQIHEVHLNSRIESILTIKVMLRFFFDYNLKNFR